MPRTSRSGPAADLASRAIKQARADAGLSQSALASRLDTSAGYIGQLETGRTNPTVGQLATVAAAMNCQLEIRMVPIEVRTPVVIPDNQTSLLPR